MVSLYFPTFEDGKPTLQSPQSVMEMVAFFGYLMRERADDGALVELRQQISESEGLVAYSVDWILGMTGNERRSYFEMLIQALNNCWEIGQTHTFGILSKAE